MNEGHTGAGATQQCPFSFLQSRIIATEYRRALLGSCVVLLAQELHRATQLGRVPQPLIDIAVLRNLICMFISHLVK